MDDFPRSKDNVVKQAPVNALYSSVKSNKTAKVEEIDQNVSAVTKPDLEAPAEAPAPKESPFKRDIFGELDDLNETNEKKAVLEEVEEPEEPEPI